MGALAVEPWTAVSTILTMDDHLGAWKARWGIGRMNFTVAPGLYGVGTPEKTSPVLVTANYKMTFDVLRRELTGINAWILVLDTKGVNVWCAAGKGTFGTQELIQRISRTRLTDFVEHRTLILPQLGATGVSAPIVKAFSGFRIVWGPVEAADVPEFLANGYKKSEAMATIKFKLKDRLVLTPMELVPALKWSPIAVALALLFALPGDTGWLSRAVFNSVVLLSAFPLGAVIFPLLLPILPFRAFGLKGAVLGLIGILSALPFALQAASPAIALLTWASVGLITLPAVTWLAMNFTGSSTYTSQTGAMHEIKVGLPLIIGSAVVGLLAGIARIILGYVGLI